MVLGQKITAIYYTANVIEEPFGENIRKQILKSIGDIPLISVSQKPMDFGDNICVGDIGQSHINIYCQMLIGARAAKTDYVAMCEDDVLYMPSHFSFLPELDTFAYNTNRWRIFTWSKSFSYSPRPVASQLIAPRIQLIKTLEEKFEKYPDPPPEIWKFFCEPGRREKQLGVTPQKMINFNSSGPCNIIFTHEKSIGFAHQGTKKSHGPLKKDKLPHWGSAEEVLWTYVSF
jgi:hypothetical protein